MILASSVYEQMPRQHRLAAELSPAHVTRGTGHVTTVSRSDMSSKRHLTVECQTTTLHYDLSRVLATSLQVFPTVGVHSNHVTLEVVLPVGRVATEKTSEQALPIDGHRPTEAAVSGCREPVQHN